MDTDPPGVEARWRHRILFLHAALFALVLWAFLPAVDNDFVSIDDPDYVTANAMVQRGLSLDSVRWAFAATEASNWHPLTWLSHMADVELFGPNPAGHHLTNVLLHAFSTLLVFATLGSMTGATWRSFMVAALFGLHPLRVESVAWVSERKDVLAAFFWMLTLLAYVRWVKDQGTNKASATSRVTHYASPWYWLTLLCFALGLMGKQMLVTLPFALLLLDHWPLGRFGRDRPARLVLEKLPFFFLAAAASAVTFWAQRGGGAVNEALPLFARLSNATVSYARYLGKLFAPVDLSFFYPMPSAWPLAYVAGAALLLMAITVAAVVSRTRQPAFLIGWLWYLGTLVPVIGLVAIGQQSLADRYTYIPSLGVFLALVWGIHALVAGREQLVTAAGTVTGVGLLVCVALTREQTRHWRNTESLCRHALRVTSGNYVAHSLLGMTLGKQGRAEEALRQHQEALRINPDSPEVQNIFGAFLQQQGDFAAAVPRHQEAIRLRPRYAEALYNLATAQEQTGHFTEAMTNYWQAIAVRPTYADAHYNLGTLYLRLNRWEDARQQFERTLAFTPNSPDTLNNLGVALTNLGRFAEAVPWFERAIQWKPDDPRFYFNAAACLQQLGNLTSARHCYQEALRLKPDYLEARANLEALGGLKTNR